jgi:putative IMPACT (imprinted ancient) family translation regulator
VAGKPTLKVMQGHKLINTAIITVRYFGGIKLGMGGMVRAYSDSANALFEEAELIPYIDYAHEEITFAYPLTSQIEYLCQTEEIIIDTKTFEKEVTFGLKGTKEKLNTLLDKITQL